MLEWEKDEIWIFSFWCIAFMSLSYLAYTYYMHTDPVPYQQLGRGYSHHSFFTDSLSTCRVSLYYAVKLFSRLCHAISQLCLTNSCINCTFKSDTWFKMTQESLMATKQTRVWTLLLTVWFYRSVYLGWPFYNSNFFPPEQQASKCAKHKQIDGL